MLRRIFNVFIITFVIVGMGACRKLDARYTGWYQVSPARTGSCYLNVSKVYVDIKENHLRTVTSVQIRNEANKVLFEWNPSQAYVRNDLEIRDSEIGGLSVERSLRRHEIKGSQAIQKEGLYMVGTGFLVIPFVSVDSKSTSLKTVSIKRLKLEAKSSSSNFFIFVSGSGGDHMSCLLTRL